MAKTIKCDRCGQIDSLATEVTWALTNLPPEAQSHPPQSWDLCHECSRNFKNWIAPTQAEGKSA